MKSFLKLFFKDESGASAAEYALILASVGVALGAAALAARFLFGPARLSDAVVAPSDTTLAA